MLVMILGVVSLALWANFNRTSPGRHASYDTIPMIFNLLWFIVSLMAIVVGYILLATG